MEKPKLEVSGSEISVRNIDGEDYICLTDIVKNLDEGKSVIGNWISTKSTIEFLGIWERLNNPNFKFLEFQELFNAAGVGRFSLSPQRWIELTQSIGIRSRMGRNGGIDAHRDIAFEFAAWLSPEFKFILIKEFQRLKEKEKELEHWDYRRFLSKVNYRLHTDSVKDYVLPKYNFPKKMEGIIYAGEADILNMAVFGCTAAQWKEQNPTLAQKGMNIRDVASLSQLTVLANIESQNSTYVMEGLGKEERLKKLSNIAESQLKSLDQFYIKPQMANLLEPPKKMQNLKIEKPFDETVSRILKVKRPE